MNPLTNVKNINKLNEVELSKGFVNKKSWHDMYKESAWIFIGGIPYDLTEGDILCVFSQYGEIVNLNLVRDNKTGKSKGFCFLCYANQKSTVLAVDNFNGIKLLERTIRVDHVANYKPPKENKNDDEITKHLKAEGCAPKPIKQEETDGETEERVVKKEKKSKKAKKKHKKKLKKEKRNIEGKMKEISVKKEKMDSGYLKYEFPSAEPSSRTPLERSSSVDSESSSSSSDSEIETPHHNKKRTLEEDTSKRNNVKKHKYREYPQKEIDSQSSRHKHLKRNNRDNDSSHSEGEPGEKKRDYKAKDKYLRQKHVLDKDESYTSSSDVDKRHRKENRYKDTSRSKYSSDFEKETRYNPKRSASDNESSDDKRHYVSKSKKTFHSKEKRTTGKHKDLTQDKHYKSSDRDYVKDRVNHEGKDYKDKHVKNKHEK